MKRTYQTNAGAREHEALERRTKTARTPKPQRILEGFSESAWKSLAVKSLRMGWPAGIAMARGILGKSAVSTLLTCGVFEDIFPAEADLESVFQDIRSEDWPALCRWQTHHGRGNLTVQFCGMEAEAVAAAETKRAEMWTAARILGIWLPTRCLNCFWTWLQVQNKDEDQIHRHRLVSDQPWRGMPIAMLDGHTMEGKALGKTGTVLSGHYPNHLRLAEIVKRDGWESICAFHVHAGLIAAPVASGQLDLTLSTPGPTA